MRILHLFDHSIPLHSGYTFRSRAILREQRARGWETAHLTGPKQGSEADGLETVDGLEFYRTALPPRILRPVPLIKDQAMITAMTRRLTEVARNIRPDILHAHSPVLNARAALAVGRRLGIPVVYEVRAFWEDAAAAHGTAPEGGLRYRLTRALETRALKQADAVATICEGLRGDMIARGVDAEKIAVIPNAVDVEAFTPHSPDPDLQRDLGLEGGKVIGFIGSFYHYEGLDLLLRALPLLNDGPPLKLLLVGGGPEDETLKALVHALGLTDRVVMTGRVPHDDVGRYYALVDAFIYPRRNMRLTDLVTPLKPLEAMAQRKAVMASDIGGHRELIEHGRTGTLFSPDDPASIAAAIDAWRTAPSRAEAMLGAAYDHVCEARTWQRSVAAYAPVYERLVRR